MVGQHKRRCKAAKTGRGEPTKDKTRMARKEKKLSQSPIERTRARTKSTTKVQEPNTTKLDPKQANVSNTTGESNCSASNTGDETATQPNTQKKHEGGLNQTVSIAERQHTYLKIRGIRPARIHYHESRLGTSNALQGHWGIHAQSDQDWQLYTSTSAAAKQQWHAEET